MRFLPRFGSLNSLVPISQNLFHVSLRTLQRLKVFVDTLEMVRRSTAETPKVSSSDISGVMAAMGRKGGKIGGKRRMETMSATERSAVAAKAAKTRWAKHRNSE